MLTITYLLTSKWHDVDNIMILVLALIDLAITTVISIMIVAP